MDRQSEKMKIVDWTNRKAAMDTYRKYEQLNMTGPCYRYYNGKLQAAPVTTIIKPKEVAYKTKHKTEKAIDKYQ